jgi:hypothetical protein
MEGFSNVHIILVVISERKRQLGTRADWRIILK